jgi:hypothetical protein
VDGEELKVLADAVAWITADGELQRRVELLPLMRGPVLSRRLARVRAFSAGGTPEADLLRDGGGADVLHANSIEILSREIPGIAPAGALLLSFRALHRIAIFDADLTEVLWMWGEGELQGQHDATQLPDGRLLIFDNGTRRRRSRVIELDPRTGRIDNAISTPTLFSRLRGGAQRLPNGNTLITESDAGHVLELTPDGELVWELWNPAVSTASGRTERGVIYRLNRFPRELFPLH